MPARSTGLPEVLTEREKGERIVNPPKKEGLGGIEPSGMLRISNTYLGQTQTHLNIIHLPTLNVIMIRNRLIEPDRG